MTGFADWLGIAEDHGFGIDNLPLGVFSTPFPTPFSTPFPTPRTGVAVGDHVLDVLGVTGDPVHATGTLNAFLARGPAAWHELRCRLTEMLGDPGRRVDVEPHLWPVEDVVLGLPIEVADYVDFYSSQHHAENLGRILRPGTPPLAPNWKHLPVAYHGRAGTVRVSGTPVVRPSGQRTEPGSDVVEFGPSRRLDIEAEVGFVVGAPSTLGEPVRPDRFAEHVFGVCLVNDWSARDLQAWESAPLGPFLGKSFLTSMSPWIVPLAALEAARVAPPARDRDVLAYLRDDHERGGLDIQLGVRLAGELISTPPFATMYWTPAQQLAHLSANGASVRTGDLFASGTVSGPAPSEWGSLIELTRGGEQPLALADGSTRAFLADGDEVRITASAPGPGRGRIGFGEVVGTVVPAPPAPRPGPEE